MNLRFWIALVVVMLGLSALVAASVSDTSRKVVTVNELLAQQGAQHRIRLGARVTEDTIDYRTSPEFFLSFRVRDIGAESSGTVNVVYRQMMPNTLQAGRDVILEGDYDGSAFQAKSLLTQCPSKYEPPLPGSTSSGEAGHG